MSMREERRVVTAVFADLVGSTALGERLDPEELKLVVGEAVSRMVVAVEAFDGHVKDLAGDGVLAIFGAPTSHEDDAERAVRAGLRIVEEIAAFGQEIERSWGVAEVDVRVGIETGPVVTGAIGGGSRVEYSALGDAVNTASRLQGQAVPGTVLVGAETHRSVADSFAWGPVRELTLKGKGSPVEAYPVAGVAGASPGPSRGRRVPMIGREAELALADSLVEGAVLGGSGAILYLSGEPGIGKTRMMQELRELVRGAQPAHGRSLWLEGRCVSYGESMSYWPFRDLLRSWLGVAPDDPDLRVTIALRRAVDRLFGARAGELTPYLGALLELSFGPDADAKLAELSPEAAQFRTFEVVRHLIERLAEDGPVVMAFEDLHWADATSLLLLEQLFADTEASPLLIVCTGRPERDHPSWRLKDETARTMPHRFREIALGVPVRRLGLRTPDGAGRPRHAAGGDGRTRARVRRRQPLLPGRDRALVAGRRGPRAHRGGAALRSRGRCGDPTHRGEGDPGPDRPARTVATPGVAGRLGPRPPVQPLAPGRGRGRLGDPLGAVGAAAAGLRARGPPMARTRVPLQARA